MSSALSELSASHDAVDDGSEDKFPLCNDRAEALARSFVASIPGMVDSDEDAPGLGLQRKSRMSTRATLPKAALRLAVQLDAANVREARRAVVDALLVRVDALRGKQGALLAELRDAAAAETARTGRAASPLIVPLLAEENDTTLDACDDALDAALVARIQELQVARARLGKWAEKRDDAEGGTSRLASSASLSRDVVARSTSSRLPRPRTQPRDTSATNVPVDAPSPRPLRSENISQRTQSRIDMHKRLHRTKSMLRISRIEERIGQVRGLCVLLPLSSSSPLPAHRVCFSRSFHVRRRFAVLLRLLLYALPPPSSSPSSSSSSPSPSPSPPSLLPQ